MSAVSVIDLYDRLANAPDERTRAKVIAEAFEMLEARYPHLPDLATRQHLSETELKLSKEIEQVRLATEQVRLDLTKEIEQVRLDLTKEIEQVRLETEQVRREIKEVELKLSKEIEQVRLDLTKEIKQVRLETERVRAGLLKWSFMFWLTQFAAILAILWRLGSLSA